MKTIKRTLAPALTLCLVFLFTMPVIAQEDKEKHESQEFKMGNVKVENMGDDTVVVYINKGHGHDHDCDMCSNWSTVPFGCKKHRFNGHWAGVDFGWNGYVNSNFNMDFPANEQYMNLNAARSLMVNLNPFELNLNIAKNKFGLVSGLGFQLSNYYFSGNYTLNDNGPVLTAYRLYNSAGALVPMEINKLYVSYLTLPVLFEFQTNARCRMNSFHIGAGVIGGVRLCSYQKQKLTTWDQPLYLKDDQGNLVSSFTPDEQKVKNKEQFYLNPFKVDAAVRVGWSFLNFFATYSITEMFQENKGPEVFPYTVGITLIGW
jgi:hypothetical protein